MRLFRRNHCQPIRCNDRFAQSRSTHSGSACLVRLPAHRASPAYRRNCGVEGVCLSSISFWGGVGTVTGSKYLVQTNRARVLVDCGMFQGLKELRERNWQEPPFDPHSLNAVLITHAHIDHTGYLPRLVKQGFNGPVYCSRGTADLLKILLPDSGRLQEEDADYRNRHNLTKHQPALPLYTEKDAYASLEMLEPVDNNGEMFAVAPGISAGFRIAGHILGSSLVLLELDHVGRRVLFSGDLGHYDQPI